MNAITKIDTPSPTILLGRAERQHEWLCKALLNVEEAIFQLPERTLLSPEAEAHLAGIKDDLEASQSKLAAAVVAMDAWMDRVSELED